MNEKQPAVTQARAAQQRRVLALLWQLPMLLLVAGLYVFFLRVPYCSLDSDAVNFGLMGEDVYKYGHLTTLAYGQNYLLSISKILVLILQLYLALQLMGIHHFLNDSQTQNHNWLYWLW